MTTCPQCGTRYSASQRLCPHDGTVLEPDQAPELKQVGKVLDGKYRLDSYLSRGGMGAVYRATHVMLGRAVAVKLIKADLVTSPDIVRRFQREARAVTHLNHPNIVEVYDLGQTEDGTLYIAMELVSGESLSAMIKAAGPLPPDRIVRILGQVVSALALAHRTNIVHRDLKPHNIMVGQGEDGLDVAKLLDFGIAKTFEIDAGTQLTTTGATLGTPQYMSPEQASGAEIDGRSDLYSLGIILYEMLIGEVPFSDPSTPAVLVKHMSETPMPPSRRRPDLRVSPALEAIALRCLEKDPANRFQTAGELGAELQRTPIEPIEDEGATIPLRRPAPRPGQTTTPTVLDPTVPSAAAHVDAATVPASAAAATTPAATNRRAATRPAAEPPVPIAPPPLPLPPPPVPGTRPTVAAVAPPLAAPPVVAPVAPRSRSMLVPIAALVVLIALLGAGYWAMTRPSEEPAPGSATSSPAPTATPAMADPGKPAASPPAAAIATSTASPAAPPPAPRAAATSSPAPTRSSAGAAGQPAPPATRAAPGAAPQMPGREPGAPGASPVPASPSVSFECTGPSEVCGPLRSAIQEVAEREGLTITRSRGAEILLIAEVSIVDRRQQVQFGTTLVTTTYSMDISGESPRFDQSIPMPASTTFSADARIGAERYNENARLAAADAIERVQQFWKKRMP